MVNKKFTDGSTRKKAQEKWKATVDSRSKVQALKEKPKKVEKTEKDSQPISLDLSSQKPQQALRPRGHL